MLDSEPLLVH